LNLPRFDSPVAFVDVETTGGHAGWHRVTDVAIVAMRGGDVEWEWHSLVNPGAPIPPSIQVLTGITHEMVADAPRFEDLAGEILRRLEGRTFVAHNVRFDYGFIRTELRRAGHNFSAPQVCTVRLSRHLYPDGGRHNLDSVMARHGITSATRHRALPDAQILAKFWRVLRAEWPAERLEAALETVSRRPVLPPQIPPGLVDDLPESSGVYRFFGEGDALIYVGKAKNIRERVLEHFGGASRDAKSQRLSAQTQRIDWTETAGELGALLLESRLVRELKPVYNRRLRGGESWTWVIGDDGAAPRLVDLDAGERGDEGDAFGLYGTAKQAKAALLKIARDTRLCLKVLGLEAAGAGSCFGHQVGRCAGACIGAEPLARHGARLKLALAPKRLKSWPYRGPVGIRETSTMGFTQVHVVDQWQYLGSMTEDDPEPPANSGRRFDADAYRILTRYLKPGLRSVRPLAGAPRGRDARAHDPAHDAADA
jgi:DNA polymerase-3 subunit epsilon